MIESHIEDQNQKDLPANTLRFATQHSRNYHTSLSTNKTLLSTNKMPKCKVCGRTFKSFRGLNQHLTSTSCGRVHEASLGVAKDVHVMCAEEAIQAVLGLDGTDVAMAKANIKKRSLSTLEEDPSFHKAVPQDAQELGKLLDLDRKMPARETHDRSQVNDSLREVAVFEDSDDDFLLPMDSENDDENHQSNDQTPDKSTLRDFRDYCANARANFAPLDDNKRQAIKLLDILRRKKAPLDSYDEVMEWHLRSTGKLLPSDKVTQTDDFISRKVLMKHLSKRYNQDDKFPTVKHVILPYSRARVGVVLMPATKCVESLLTDPRLCDDDFSFHDNNPFAKPPEGLDYISDLSTGEAYRQGHKKYVTKPNQIGVGIQWYIDGAVTGQFENLEIIALKMSLSVFSRNYRMKDHAWRTLGYVVNYSKAGSRGKKLFADSKHVDSTIVAHQLLQKEGEQEEDADVTSEKAQDFHKQLATILESYVTIEQSGMLWDLFYQGQVHKADLVFWTIMVRCDTDEAELLTGKYRSRSGNVKNLCRYCTCPNEETDDPLANHPLKTVEMVKGLIEAKDLDGLKAISQQNINNSWYKLRFSNPQGIHGACPSEMLHAVLLGIFKYARECFFHQIGESSALAGEINALAQQYGVLFGRQSERDIPKCKFAEGIRKKGKLMAKEYRGVLLVMAVVLRSTEGQKLLKKNRNFKEDYLIKDWLLLVEMLLEWEAYLCEPKMKVAHVRRMLKKNRFIMHILKKVMNRSVGMGLKLMKFHAIIHLAVDIILYGVPMEHDTGANESGHKVTKTAAKLTQKKASVFELQTATRLAEFFIIELAMLELAGRPIWEYFDGYQAPIVSDSSKDDDNSTTTSDLAPTEDDIETRGARIVVFEDADGTRGYEIKSRMKDPDSVLWSTDARDALLNLQQLVSPWQQELQIHTEHVRNGQIFRAHPNYRQEGPWQDWVLVDWGAEYGRLPCEIWAFVVLENLPEVDDDGQPLYFGGIDVTNGTYALVEASTWSKKESELEQSDIFVPFTKDVGATNSQGIVTSRKFYLADVEAIVAPLCVVADIGSKPCHKYFQVKPRSAWAADFVSWLEDPHANDDMDD